MSLSIVSLNCRGLRNIVKRKAIFLYLKRFNTDFCFLQECHSDTQDVNFWRSQWGLDLWLAHGTTHSAGVCILKNRFKGKILSSECDTSGHYILLALEIFNSTCIVINVYGFNLQRENNAFFDRLGDRVTRMLAIYPNSSLIFGGDFNVVLDNRLDRWPPQAGNLSPDYVITFMEKFSLIDTWRKSHPTQQCFTWSNNSLSSQSRIDYWLTSKDLDNIVTDIIPSPFSDHKAISVTNPVHALPFTHLHRSLVHHIDSYTTLLLPFTIKLHFPSSTALTQLFALITLTPDNHLTITITQSYTLYKPGTSSRITPSIV